MEANGFSFELLGARGPQNNNRLLFDRIVQTRRPDLWKKPHPGQECRKTVFILSSWGPKGLKLKPFASLQAFSDPPLQTHGEKLIPERNGGKRFLF